jgi:hypothetical protein
VIWNPLRMKRSVYREKKERGGEQRVELRETKISMEVAVPRSHL